MVTALQKLEAHRYGGLARRYTVHKGGLLGCVDPIAVTPVAFSTELQYENWLMHWLDPTITSLDHSLRPWECIDRGQRRTFKPHLVVGRRATLELQHVCRTEDDLKAGQRHSYERIAEAHGVSFVLRTRAQIRASVPVLRHLKRLRQRATSLLHRPLVELQQGVLDRLAASPASLRELRASLGHDAENHELDAALVPLCRLGLVSLNLSEIHYEDITAQAHAHRSR